MRRILFASLLAIAASTATAEPISKDQLMTAPAGARHYTFSSIAGKHGDVWSWTMPDGRIAYRMSMSLRGWVTETDEVMTLGPDKRPTAIAIRGYTDQGDATETFDVDAGGVARWKTVIDSGSAPFADKRYNTYGGPPLAAEREVDALVAAGDKGIDMLPGGHASITIGQPAQIDGPNGAETVKLAFIRGYSFAPLPVWLDKDNRFFGNAGVISLLPEGYEKNGPKLKEIQDKATAAMVRDVAHQFLTPANRTPTLVDHVLMFDSVAGKYLPDRAVLIAGGKVAAVAAGGSIKPPAGATVIDGRGKTLSPGLWDSHQHVGDDWNLLQNVATGMTNYRSPGSLIDDAHSIYRRRAAGDLLAPDGKISVIIDRKDPLA
ncbi:MAG: amidohydrolase, partial [Sphingomonas sp.]|nr:amidohydrolase [Sphingomonas sp.]